MTAAQTLDAAYPGYAPDYTGPLVLRDIRTDSRHVIACENGKPVPGGDDLADLLPMAAHDAHAKGEITQDGELFVRTTLFLLTEAGITPVPVTYEVMAQPGDDGLRGLEPVVTSFTLTEESEALVRKVFPEGLVCPSFSVIHDGDVFDSLSDDPATWNREVLDLALQSPFLDPSADTPDLKEIGDPGPGAVFLLAAKGKAQGYALPARNGDGTGMQVIWSDGAVNTGTAPVVGFAEDAPLVMVGERALEVKATAFAFHGGGKPGAPRIVETAWTVSAFPRTEGGLSIYYTATPDTRARLSEFFDAKALPPSYNVKTPDTLPEDAEGADPDMHRKRLHAVAAAAARIPFPPHHPKQFAYDMRSLLDVFADTGLVGRNDNGGYIVQDPQGLAQALERPAQAGEAPPPVALARERLPRPA